MTKNSFKKKISKKKSLKKNIWLELSIAIQKHLKNACPDQNDIHASMPKNL